GWLQALSALGNITAALIGILLAFLVRNGTVEIESSWRIMFVVGTIPAVLVLVIMRRLKEPEKWLKLAAEKSLRERMGAYSGGLFRESRWTRNAIVGLILASAGIIGLWAIGFFSIDLTRAIFEPRLKGLEPKEAKFWQEVYASLTSIMFNVGAFF